jgi:RND family efflux transporter MFP subunit
MDKLKNTVSQYSARVTNSKIGAKVTGTVSATWGKKYGKWAIILGGLILTYIAYSAFSPEKPLETVIVKSGGNEAIVSVQGTVEAAQDVELGFEGAGKVAWVGVKVGDTVRAGQTLATLSQGDLSAQIASLVATRDAANAKLDDLKRGTLPEDIAVSESQVASAQSQVDLAGQSLVDALNESYSKFDDAIRTKTDTFFSNPRSSAPHFDIATDSSIKINLENERAALEWILTDLQHKVFTTPSAEDVAAQKALATRVRSYLDAIATAINTAQSYNSLSTAQIETYKTAIAAARSAVSGYITTLTSTQTQYTNLSIALKTAQSQLALKKRGATPEDIRAQEAQVRAANANIAATQATAAKKSISAPFAGLITKVEPKVGSIVTGGASGTIALISSSRLQVEAYVPEVYIAKITVGDAAEVTLDAYSSNEIFKAKVSTIEPSSTIRDGINTYKTVLTLDAADTRVRPGMGGDIIIHTKAENPIITIPKTALITRNGKQYVQIPTGSNNTIIEREVTVGKINEADVAEITEGLADGDTIVLTPVQ